MTEKKKDKVSAAIKIADQKKGVRPSTISFLR